METLTQTLTRELGLGTTQEFILSLSFFQCVRLTVCLRLPAFGCGAYQVNYLLIGESQQMRFFL